VAKEERILQEALSVLVSFTGDNDSEMDVENCRGTAVVTSERLIFWSEDPNDVENDLIIEAECIDLHALAQDPVSVYLQIQNNSEASNPLELTVLPSREEDSQSLFDNVTQLIILHPIDPHEDDEDGMFAGDFVGNDDDDDLIVNTPTSQLEATPEEYSTMLERLDRLLVVPEDFGNEKDDGRFDDADDDPFL
jgi:hypothetical protein